MSDSPFWNAVNGPGGDLIPATEIEEAEEAEIVDPTQAEAVEPKPSFAQAEAAVLALPDQELKGGGERRRKLLIYAGVPLLLLVGLIMLNSGGKKASTSQVVAPMITQPTYGAVPYTPAPIQQTEQKAKTPVQLLSYAAQKAQSHFVGQTPGEAALVSYLHKALGVTVVGSSSGSTPENSIQVTAITSGRFLLTYTGKKGQNVFATRGLNLGQ